MSFPILTCAISAIKTDYISNTISVNFDGGYTQTRERNTRNLKTFEVTYPLLQKEDKNAVIAHYESVRGATPFSWRNDDTGEDYTVRYKEPVSVSADGKTSNLYTLTIKLEGV